MARSHSLLLAIAIALPLAAQTSKEVTTTVLVPVVGTVTGAGNVIWKTDVELVNDTRQEVDVALSLPTAGDAAIFVTMAPNSVQRFGDVVGEAFGLETAMSPLMITTRGRRSVRVNATVYGIVGGTMTQPEPIALTDGNTWYPIRTLRGLTFSDDFRTNIGLANLGEKDANFTLALQRVAGRNLAISRVTVKAGTLWHLSIQSLFPLITKGDDFKLVVETRDRDTYAYASVIDNATNEARFIQPLFGAPTEASAQAVATTANH
jgi:hypothetical protein